MTSGGILCEYFVLWRYGLSRLNTHYKQGCNEHTATMDLKKVAGWKNTDLTMIIIIYIIASMIIDNDHTYDNFLPKKRLDPFIAC